MRFRIIFSLIAGITGCATSSRDETHQSAYSDYTPAFLAKATGAGAWQHIDESTLSFEGVISSKTADDFLSAVNESTKTVLVNSAGGDVSTAIRVGFELRRRQINLIVYGYCLSSCANYWTTSAPSVTLEQGIIGFHGNLTSCIKIFGGLDGYLNKDFKNDTPAAQRAAVRRDVEKSLIAEREFYSALERDPLAHLDYCRPDKGKGGRTLSLIAPNTTSLKNLGINVITGQQSEIRVEEFNGWSQEPILLE